MSMSVSTASASPPTHTKSSASVSTTYKPKRNKSSSSLHSAGGHHSIHHHVQMPQHVRKSSHGSSGATRPRLTSSGSSSSSAKKSHFGAGLGMMTSISNPSSQTPSTGTQPVAQAGLSISTTGAASQAAHTETETEIPAQVDTEGLDASPQDELGDLGDSRASRDQRPPGPVASMQEPERGRSRSRSMDRRAAQSTERHHANAQGRDGTLPPGPGGRGERSEGSPKRQRSPAVSQTRQPQPPPKKVEKAEKPSEAVGANQTSAAPAPAPAPASAPTMPVKEKHSRAKFDFANDEDDGDDDEEEERQGRKLAQERATEASADAVLPANDSTVDKTPAAPPPVQSPTSPELQATKEVPTRPPMHTKSSSNLSVHTVRPKRNKSSSSLHHAHHGPGHHNVQFAGAAKKRSGSSSGRTKPAFGFGMTTLPAEDHHDRRGSDSSSTKGARSSNRPAIDRRRSSTSTLVNDNVDDRSARGRTDSRGRTEVARTESDQKASTPLISPSTSRSRPSKKHTATKETQEVAGSQSSASGWESATNSPFAIAKTLPSTTYRPEAVSGLAQVMGRGDEVAGIVADDGEEDDSADEGAKESRKVDVAPMSPPSTISRPAASLPATQSPLRSSSQPGPSDRQPSGSSKAPSAPATNTITFPTSSDEPPSPPRVHARPAAANVRKGSNASLMSNASTRSVALSFAGRMGPPAPMFRRTGTATAPALVDRGHVGAELIGTDTPVGSFDNRRRTSGGPNPSMPAGRQVVSHARTDSINSVRSLRTTAETSPQARRTDPGDGRQSADGGRRSIDPRASSEYASSGSTALAALGSIASQAGSTRPLPTSDGSGGTFRRSASGYFSSALRGLTGLQALTPPLSPSASSRGGPMAGYGASTASSSQHPASTIAKNKSRSSPSPAYFIQPVVSKFVETPPPVSSVLLSRSPAAINAMDSAAAAKRSQSSASLNGMGAMSRTQQKAFLARDAPYFASGGGGNTPSSAHGKEAQAADASFWALAPQIPPGVSHPPTAASTRSMAPAAHSTSTALASDEMQNWARRFIVEAERIERQYRAVEKWRDPLGESLERVWAKRAKGTSAGTVSSAMVANPSNGVARAVGV